MITTLILFYLIEYQLTKVSSISNCDSPSSLLAEAHRIENNYNEPILENGYLIDRRRDNFLIFEKACLNSFLKMGIKNINEHDNESLLSAAKKSYFYTRNEETIEKLQKYFDSNGGYPLFEEFSKGIFRFRSLSVDEETLIDSDFTEVKLRKSNTILIISSPYCRFSGQLSDWLASKSYDKKKLEVIWAYKAPVSFDLNQFFSDQKNRKYKVIFDISKWDDVKYWGTPTVYFYNNGSLEKQAVGFVDETKQVLLEIMSDNQ